MDGPGFAMIETWTNAEALDAHSKSEHIRQFMGEVGNSITVDIKKYVDV